MVCLTINDAGRNQGLTSSHMTPRLSLECLLELTSLILLTEEFQKRQQIHLTSKIQFEAVGALAPPKYL